MTRGQGTGVIGLWRRPRGERRLLVAWLAVVCVALLVAAGAVGARAWTSRDVDARDPAPVEAAARAVGAVLTFGFDDTPERRARVAELLTGALAADYEARGPDAVFPGSVASKVRMTTEVTDAAPAVTGAASARVLVFVDQRIAVGARQAEPWTPDGARWAWMTRVGDRWLLSRLESAAL